MQRQGARADPGPAEQRVIDTTTLSPAQLERYRPLFDNTKRLRALISELETLSAEAVEQAEGWTAP